MRILLDSVGLQVGHGGPLVRVDRRYVYRFHGRIGGGRDRTLTTKGTHERKISQLRAMDPTSSC